MASIRGSSIKRCVGVLFVWLCLLSLTPCVHAEDNGEATTEQGPTEPTTIGPFVVNIDAEARATSSLTIKWWIPKGYDVVQYEVSSSKTSSNATTRSGPLDPDEGHYKIEDLATNTEYEVCVEAVLEEEKDEDPQVFCEKMRTIPVVLVSSIVVCFGVLAFIVLLVLIGYCVWKREYAKVQAKLEEAENEEQEKIKPNETQQTYMPPPNPNQPKASIEDHDIPYITPPVEQLSPSDKDRYKKAVV